ncbi:MAG TPA: hypothetical protein VLC71_08260 [Thermomonas sp.]|nr:hypothetical protein [Thermomonas sp.]
MGELLSGADATYQDGYRDQIKVGMQIAPGGDMPFGESINLYTGELSFLQPDVVVKGNGPSIVIARFNQLLASSQVVAPLPFGTWNASIPRIELLVPTPGQYAHQQGTVGGNWLAGGPTSYERCSYFGSTYAAGLEWFTGMFLVDETGATHDMLTRDPAYPGTPSITVGGSAVAFPIVTTDNWQVGCLSQTANASMGEAAQAGEAFLAVSPDGTKYFFNYAYGSPALHYSEADPSGGPSLRSGRMFARMYVTRIEDRFGNYLTYGYSSGKLQSITASDGRSVSLTWRSDSAVISTITVNASDAPARVWQYAYTSISTSGATLSTVTLPDSSQWSFTNVPTTGGYNVEAYDSVGAPWTTCGATTGTPVNTASGTATITNPAGLTGTFTIKDFVHARSYVPGMCVNWMVGTPPYQSIPAIFGSVVVTNRSIAGPGVPSQSWTYAYSAPNGSFTSSPCAATNTCPDTATVTITEPSGDKTVHTYSTRWGAHEGKLLQTQTYQGASTLLRTVVNTYAAANTGPWPARVGDGLTGDRTNIDKLETWTPTLRTDTTQQGRTFTWRVPSVCGAGSAYCFDTFARPTQVVKSSAP